MAILTPLLLIMFLGLFETGYAIRSYIVLVNANRETARFLARGLYTDEEGVAHGLGSLSRQIPFELGQNATTYVHHLTVCPESPFDPADDERSYSGNVFGELLPSHVVTDTLFVQATQDGNAVNEQLYRRELIDAQNTGNEARRLGLLAHDFETWPLDWSCEEMVYVETSYLHKQLLGFFGDWRIPFYVHTAMRVATVRGL
jgi:hypothetical protein